ncbi:hypothetical protein PPACK8108_LOCUS25036 [Phakopsora pachyrhizi]|uniref:Uncharacterized protein n=1 Tax=Phakopsora pachyrhizi TaxID=170000 RepID=A0AAV0BW91_PHAPC|nr:hypothetical protein PPACK8108_LOCUS25036 [Phakopsora pachyrhizi]
MELKVEENKSSALTPCWVLGRWEAGQPVLGSALQGWVLGRWQSGQRSRLAGLARQFGQGSGVDRGSWGFLGFAESEAGGAGQLGLGTDLLGWVLGRVAGFVGAGRSSRPGQSGQVGLAGRLAWLGRWGRQGTLAGWVSQGRAAGAAGARLGFAGLGPRQGRAARAWLGFAGLGPRQVAVRGGSAGRAGHPGLGLALLGWVLGRWQAGQGRGLGFAGLGLRQAAVRGGAAGAWLGFAGLGPRQVAVRAGQVGLAGRWGSLGRAAGVWLGFAESEAGEAGQPGLGSDLLGWVLGRLAGWGSQGRAVGLTGAARGGSAGRAGHSALLGWVLGRWQSGQGRWGMQGQPGLVRKGRSQRHISSTVLQRIKDSTLNKGLILALLDDTALPGAKAESMDVESDGCCDDDNQIRPLHLFLRPAPYNEGSGHWARTINGGAADRLWEEIDQTLSVNLNLYNEELAKTKAAGKATWFTASWLDYDPFESSKLLTLCSSYDSIAKLTLKLEQFLSSLSDRSKLDDGTTTPNLKNGDHKHSLSSAKKSRDERDLKVKDKDWLRIDFVLDNKALQAYLRDAAHIWKPPQGNKQ